MGAAESHTAKKQVNVDEAKAPRRVQSSSLAAAAAGPPRAYHRKTLALTQEFFSAKLVVGGDDKPETLLPISYWKEASEDEEATATFAYYCAVGRRVVHWRLRRRRVDGAEARRVPRAGTGRQVPGQVHAAAPAAGRRVLRG